MNPYIANLINALTMMALGYYGYSSSANPSPTALIPVFLGVILLTMSMGIKHESKAQAHIAVIVTLIAFLALFMPLMGAFKREDNNAAIRIGIMILTNLVALVYFIRSFIQAKKARIAAGK
jgi:FtsH-binding integral membrane protein